MQHGTRSTAGPWAAAAAALALALLLSVSTAAAAAPVDANATAAAAAAAGAGGASASASAGGYGGGGPLVCPPCPTLPDGGVGAGANVNARRRLFGEAEGGEGSEAAPHLCSSSDPLDAAAGRDFARFRAAVMATVTEDELREVVAAWQEEEEEGRGGGVGAALARAWAAARGLGRA